MRILFSGGGTGGSVTPLLAVMQEIAESHADAYFLWLGTFRGPEKKLVQKHHIKFLSIFSGKLRRYVTWRNFVDPFFIFAGFIQSLYIIKRFDPHVVVAAGGFVSVPVVLAAKVFRKKILIHQLDIQKGLANKLAAPFANVITVSFPESVKDFPEHKVHYIGTPIRKMILDGDRVRAQAALNLHPELPTILVFGGGTGSLAINKLINAALPEILNFAQVIHITGTGKSIPVVALKEKAELYHSFDFVVEELPNLFAAADLVVARSGIGSLTELAALGKPTITIPMPHTHQVLNAKYFQEHKAVLYVDQEQLSAQTFTEELRELLNDTESLRFLSKQIHALARDDANKAMHDLIISLYEQAGNRA